MLKIISSIFLAVIFIPAHCYSQTAQDYLNEGNKYYSEKNYAQASEKFKNLLALLENESKNDIAQKIAINIANIYIIQEDYANALVMLQKAERLYSQPDMSTKFNLYTKKGQSLYQLNKFEEAADTWVKILHENNKIDDEFNADLNSKIANAYRRMELYYEAIHFYKIAEKLYAKLNDQEQHALILNSLGLCYNKVGDFAAALRALELSLKISTELKNPLIPVQNVSNLGAVFFDLGEYTNAEKYFAQAVALAEENNLQVQKGRDLNNIGLVLKSAGQYDKSLVAIEASLKIAQEHNEKRDQAIALSNKALVTRILGGHSGALKDYRQALALYQEEGYQEGEASCYLGIGKLHETSDLDYKEALANYEKAYAIYEKLGNRGYMAESLNQIGRILKKNIDHDRTEQSFGSIIFEGQPIYVNISPDDALLQSKKAFEYALELGRQTGRREVVWSALQGIGFTLFEQNQLNESLDKYLAAIEIVTQLRGAKDAELMMDYLRDKEDLFIEALDVCSSLYENTHDDVYISKQVEIQEVYKNDIMKNSMSSANLNFENPEKNSLAKKINESSIKQEKNERLPQKKASQTAQNSGAKSTKKTPGNKDSNIKTEYDLLLAEWKKKYPEDSCLFDSAQKIDIKKIQANLHDDDAIIQYMSMHKSLGIICITKDSILYYEQNITSKELASLIRNEFSRNVIEIYGHEQYKKDKLSPYANESQAFKYALDVMKKLTHVLIEPVYDKIKGKNNLHIITSGYISYVPFDALLISADSDNPHFLIEDHTINYSRLTFFDGKIEKNEANKAIIGIGNPKHDVMSAVLGNLPNAESELKTVEVESKNKKFSNYFMYGKEATEANWRREVDSKNYSIFYFATHGVPYAELYQDSIKIKNRKDFNARKEYVNFVKFVENTFPTLSPLNGFLYMSNSDEHDGVLTMKEILEIPDSYFNHAQIAILSACNTAVTYSPKITEENINKLEAEAQNIVPNSGFHPGVDQISLTETFMMRNFDHVVGTLWFADDASTGFIMRTFYLNYINGDSPAIALRNAKLAYLKNPDLALSSDYTEIPRHPYFWAVTTVFGR